MNYYKHVILFAFALALVEQAMGQPSPNYQALKFVQITTADGLPYPVIREIAQDSLGFMWFTTQTKVCRYDGINFHEYPVNQQNLHDMAGEDSEAIFADSKGRLWIGTKGFLHRHIDKYDYFQKWYVALNSTSDKDYQIVNYIAEDHQQNIWIGSSRSVLKINEYPDKGWKLDFISYPLHINESDIAGDVRYLFTDNNSILWITSDQGLYYYNEKADSFYHYKNPILKSTPISMACYSQDGTLWVGTANKLYAITNLDTNYRHSKTQIVARDFGHVNSLLLDQHQALWIGTTNGLYIKPKNASNLIQYVNNPSPYSITNNIITDIYMDNMGLIWIGTRNGISVYDPYRFKFELYSNSEHQKLSQVFGICEDSHENIWLTTIGEGIFNIDRNTNQVYNYPYPLNQTGLYYSIVSNKKNTFWLSNFNPSAGGLIRLDIDSMYYKNRNPKYITTKKFTDFDAVKNNNRIKLIRELTLVGDTLLYFTGREIGLGIATLKNNLPINYKYILNNSYTGKKHFYANNTTNLLIDSLRGTWVGTLGAGAWRYTPGDSIINYDYVDSTASQTYGGLSGRQVSCLLRDHQNRIWLGTNSGLNLYIDSTDNFRHFTTEHGLPSNNIAAMELTDDNKIWISTNKGLCLFDPISFTTKVYNEFDGIQGLDFNPFAYQKLRSGEIVFGGSNGINIIPERINNKHLPHKPHVVFTNLFVNYKKVPALQKETKDRILSKELWQTSHFKLNPKQNNFQIHFVATSFSRPHKNLYKYKLENYNDEWIETNFNAPFASYNNLRAGKYLFKVKAANADGIWNETPSILHITIEPRITERIWFRILVILVILCSIILIVYLRTKSLQQRRRLLEEIVRERTEEIEEKNAELEAQTDQLKDYNALLEERQGQIEMQSEELSTQNDRLQEVIYTKDKLFSIIAHDLKNPFNAVMGFTQLLEQRFDKYDNQKKLELIRQTNASAASVFRLLENLLQWSRSQRGIIEVQPAQVNFKSLIDDVYSVLNSQALKKNINLLNQVDENCTLLADYSLMHTILRNLVSNAIKFTDNGIINASCIIVGDNFEISITDSGIGMPPEVKKNLFKLGSKNNTTQGTRNERGTGLGLLICHDFVEYHKGKIWVESEIGKGTTVYISIPQNLI